MRARLKPADRREGKGFAHVGPVTSPRAALRGTVPDQKSVSKLERRAADLEIDGVLPEIAEEFS